MRDDLLAMEHDEVFRAFAHVREVKRFWSGLIAYVAVISVLAAINFATYPKVIWFIFPAFGWGIGLLVQAMRVFAWLPLFGPEWEKRQVEKRLGRKI